MVIKPIDILSGLISATYIAFDILYLNKRPLMERPLKERKKLLEGLFPLSENAIYIRDISRR